MGGLRPPSEPRNIRYLNKLVENVYRVLILEGSGVLWENAMAANGIIGTVDDLAILEPENYRRLRADLDADDDPNTELQGIVASRLFPPSSRSSAFRLLAAP